MGMEVFSSNHSSGKVQEMESEEREEEQALLSILLA